ncbi:MAG: response regulator transcription factor [Magnetococcales bacterium]|nr:response regulator transcription factor [Magnetococcales bacterium]MBF0155824.1 response regulator transcription factor [Magnetococcales bacterium]
MINIFIADDHAVVREGVKGILGREVDFRVVGEASNGAEALRWLLKNPCDVAVLDVSMPEGDGLSVLNQLRASGRTVAVVILTMYEESTLAMQFLKAGASGFLTKDSATEQLVQAVRKVAAKGKYLSPKLAERLVDHLGDDSLRPPHMKLSSREFEVFRHFASGKTLSQVANELRLSPSTVSTYRTRILEKMGMQNNAELTHYAIKNALV